MSAPLPTVARLRELLRLDPETGRLYWRVRRPGTAQAGDEAFVAYGNDGYRQGQAAGHSFLAHRVVYALTHNEWPKGQIDHVNGDRTDNRPANLRDVDRTGNCRNQWLHATNSSGHVGVSWYKRYGCWVAQVRLSSRTKHLGYYKDFDDAVAARKAAEREYGFSERHGERRAA